MLLQSRLSNGTLTYKQLTEPLAVQPDVTKLQVTTTTLPEGAMYIARVSGPADQPSWGVFCWPCLLLQTACTAAWEQMGTHAGVSITGTKL
jgi:hypothetical protein